MTLTQVVLLLSFAGLLGGATWHADEYDTLAHYRQLGLDGLWFRLIHWSPRPFSELLVYGYATLVNATQLQNIILVMAIVWGMLLLSICAVAAVIYRTATPVSVGLLSVLFPIALTLVFTKTGEVFYWPFASMAYMPTIAALLAMLGILIWGDGRTQAINWGAWSIVLAGSSEIGAFFIIFLCGGLLLIGLMHSAPDLPLQHPWLKSLFPAAFTALCVVIGLMLGRTGNSSEALLGPDTAGNLSAAIQATGPEFLRQLLGEASLVGWEILPAASIKLGLGIFVLCLMSTWATLKIYRQALIAFGAAAIATVAFTVFAAYYQFGVSCCERHQTVQYFLSLSAVTAIAAAWSGSCSTEFTKRLLPVGCVVSGLMLTVLTFHHAIPKLRSDYQHYASVVDLRSRNWLFNQSPPHVFIVDPQTRLAWGSLPMPLVGQYDRSNLDVPHFNESILRFFDIYSINFAPKRELITHIPTHLLSSPVIASQNLRTMVCATDRVEEERFDDEYTRLPVTQLSVVGWLNLLDSGLTQDNVNLVLRIRGDDTVAPVYFPLVLSNRPDVAHHFQRDELLQSGYNTQVRVPFVGIQSLDIIATNGTVHAGCSLKTP